MIQAAYFQMAGQGKQINQDALFNGVEVKHAKLKKSCWVENLSLEQSLRFAVADGIFNSPNPHKASRFWMNCFAESGRADAVFLRRNFSLFCEQMLPENYGSSTTFAAVEIESNGQTKLCNVGDSRIYYIDSSGKWQQLSHDHTLLAEMIENGDANKSIDYAGIYYALAECLVADSEEADFKIFSHEIQLKNGEYVLLCSDGLSEALTHEQLEHIWQQHDNVLAKLEALRLAVKRVAFYDDCSVICVQYTDGFSQNIE